MDESAWFHLFKVDLRDYDITYLCFFKEAEGNWTYELMEFSKK